MKNKLLALLLCVFMVISSMAGCGTNGNNGENNNKVENEANGEQDDSENANDQQGESESETDNNGSNEGDSNSDEVDDSQGNEGSEEESEDSSGDDSSSEGSSDSSSNEGSTNNNSGSSSSGSIGSNSGSNSGSDSGSSSGGSTGNTGSESGEATPTEADYTVSIKSEAGIALDGIKVSVYKSGSGSALKTVKTDKEGNANFKLNTGENYTIKLSDVPLGFNAADSYSFSGNTANIVLDISLVTGEKLSKAKFNVGDVMYDFTFTSVDGTKMNLADILAEKELVVINFMYVGCVYCDKEFPFMAEAYNMFKDDMEIIALNGLAGEKGQTLESTKGYKENNNWPFIMGLSPNGLTTAFNVSAYPTTILIDRYGVICEIEPGAILTTEEFVKLFEKYLGDDYQQVLYD